MLTHFQPLNSIIILPPNRRLITMTKSLEKAFAESENVLDSLANEALTENAEGKIDPLDVNQL